MIIAARSGWMRQGHGLNCIKLLNAGAPGAWLLHPWLPEPRHAVPQQALVSGFNSRWQCPASDFVP